MLFADTLKAKLTECMKAKQDIPKNLLRVILGDVASEEARKRRPATDDEVVAVVKKLIKNNRISCRELEAHGRKDDPMMRVLCEELDFLYQIMPNKPLMQDGILNQLYEVADAIKKASNEGSALGMAMKYLKEQKCEVLSDDVKEVVVLLRK